MKNLITHLNESIKKPIFKGTIKSKYEAVDLGLSVKWCSCNIGAYKPEEPGLLFQGGKTDGYNYGDENNKFLPMNDFVSINNIKYKTGDTLDLEDDAAHVIMKGKWRMPTKEEMDELLTLPHKWTLLNGVNGYEITGKNENTIFIPAAGYFDGPDFDQKNEYGYLWSSTIKSSGHSYTMQLNESFIIPSYNSQYYGFSIRGVC